MGYELPQAMGRRRRGGSILELGRLHLRLAILTMLPRRLFGDQNTNPTNRSKVAKEPKRLHQLFTTPHGINMLSHQEGIVHSHTEVTRPLATTTNLPREAPSPHAH